MAAPSTSQPSKRAPKVYANGKEACLPVMQGECCHKSACLPGHYQRSGSFALATWPRAASVQDFIDRYEVGETIGVGGACCPSLLIGTPPLPLPTPDECVIGARRIRGGQKRTRQGDGRAGGHQGGCPAAARSSRLPLLLLLPLWAASNPIGAPVHRWWINLDTLLATTA